MDFIMAIVVSSILIVLIHTVITAVYRKKNIDGIEIEKIIENILKEQEINVGINVKEKAKASYNCEDKIITFSEGNTFLSVSEAFHELGHAIDDKDITHRRFGVPEYLLFFLLKYSLPASIVMYVIQVSMGQNNLIIPIFITTFVSVFFYFGTLWDELKATKYAKKELSKNLNLSRKDYKSIHICLYTGLASYIFLCLLVVGTLVVQILYTLNIL